MTNVVPLPLEGNTNPALDAALSYTARGWRVLPVRAADKKPFDPVTRQLMSRWQDQATTDAAQIAAWWEGRPDLGVAIATGRKSGVVVIDVDVAKGKNGPADKLRLEAEWGKLPDTLTQSTPSGGTQEFYAWPDGIEDIPNAVGLGYWIAGHQGRNLCGIDVRADAGQVNAPPTARDAGAYRWHSDPLTTPVAVLPDRWVEALSVKPAPPAKPDLFTDPDANIDVIPKGKAESVITGCAAIERLKTDPKGVTEWLWKMSAGVLGRCERGPAIFDALSKLDPKRYNPADTKAALDYMLSKSGPHSCDSFAREAPEACASCLFRGLIAGPSELAQRDPQLINLQRRHVYVTDAGKFYDFNKQLVKSKDDFSSTFAHVSINYKKQKEDGGVEIKTDGRLKQTIFMNSAISAKADTGTYTPGETRRVYRNAHGAVLANVWLNDGLMAEPGDCSVWDDHVDWLLPNDEGQRDHLLDVMAHSLQNPNVKVRHAILLISLAHQVGKGALINTWGAMLGKSNFVTVGNAELRSEFQGGMYNKQLALFDEVFIRDRDVYNDTKTIVTEPELRVQMKHKDFVEMRPPMVIVANSNKSLPFPISEPEDVRWYVIQIGEERREDDYYLRLRTEGPGQIAAFKAKLLRRDLSAFDPAAPPQMTEAKRRLISDSRTPFDRALDDVLAEQGRTVVVVAELTASVMRKNIRGSVSETEIVDGLRKRGWKARGQHRTGIGDLRGSFWSLGDDWEGAKGDVLRAGARWQCGSEDVAV